MYQLKCKYYLFLILTLFLDIDVLAQEFETSTLIDIPGVNKNYELFPNAPYWFSDTSYICWENHIDSAYNIYLQRISPDASEPIITIYSSLNESSKPTMAFSLDKGIIIIWQSIINNTWQLLGRTYNNGELTDIEQITNSEYNNISPSLSNSKLVWVSGGSLLIKTTDKLADEPYIIDSINCSNPTINKWIFKDYTDIVYEKGDSSNKQIYQAIQRRVYPSNELVWEINKISEHSNSINPRFGMEGNTVFQTQVDGFWRTCYSFWSDSITISKNSSCNRENPDVFTYPIPTVKNYNDTPFYVAFDSDSLTNNREVFIKPIIFTESDLIINISAMEGDDTHPSFFILFKENEPYLAIIWEHNKNDHTSIWQALTKYRPVIGDVEKNELMNKFYLSQNYPNPFNPTTTIQYEIPISRGIRGVLKNVTLKVYDILGKEVTTLINQQQKFGSYEVMFDASKLSSGVYYYQLKSGSFVQTRKMIFLK